MKRALIAIATLSLLLFAGCGNKVEEKATVKIEKGKVAPAIEIGRPLEAGSFKDQFDRKGGIGEGTRKVIMVFTKATGHLVKEFLNTKPDDYLEKKRTVFIADVSGMPSIILKYMALPDLRKHKYPIYLILDEKESEGFRNEKYKSYIMVIDLDGGIVKDVAFVTTAKALEKLID